MSSQLTCSRGPQALESRDAEMAMQKGNPQAPMADAVMNCATFSWCTSRHQQKGQPPPAAERDGSARSQKGKELTDAMFG